MEKDKRYHGLGMDALVSLRRKICMLLRIGDGFGHGLWQADTLGDERYYVILLAHTDVWGAQTCSTWTPLGRQLSSETVCPYLRPPLEDESFEARGRIRRGSGQARNMHEGPSFSEVSSVSASADMPGPCSDDWSWVAG